MIRYGGPELAKAHRTVRNNTIQIAEDIPEDQYGFSAAPGTRSVAKILVHVSYSTIVQDDMQRVRRVTSLAGYDFGAIIGRIRAEEEKPRSKAEIIDVLRTRGEEFAGWLDTLTPEFLAETYTDPTGQNARTRFEGLLSAKEHEMHHRGQLMLIERVLGITPHLTRQAEARMAHR